MAGVFETTSGKILGITREWADIPAYIVSWVTPIILLGLTISIMWHGYKIIRGGGGQYYLLDVFFNSLRTFLVVALCLAAGSYSTNVVDLLQELRNDLTGLFSDDTTNSYAMLDAASKKAINSYKNIWAWGADHISLGVTKTDLSGLTAIFGGFLMTLVLIIYCIVAAVYFLIIDFSLAILFAVGPLFVGCLAFQSTTSYFNTWFAAVLKYVMTAVVISAVVGLGTTMVGDFAKMLTMTKPESIDYITMTFTSLVAGVILIILTTKGTSIGAELAGGAALQIASLALAGRLAGKATGATGKIAGKSLGTAGKLAGAGIGYSAGRAVGAISNAATKSNINQPSSMSPAMKYAMAGMEMMAHLQGGAKSAMNHRSMASAARAGFQSGSSNVRGTGSISK